MTMSGDWLTTPHAQSGPPPARTAAQQYKNVQVLKDMPAALMTQTMHLIQGELGVECQFCHIWEEWDREDRPMKQVARRMLAMTAEINRTQFGGAQVITCYTCHRGSPKPVNMVILPVPKPPSVENPPPPALLPDVDQVLARYIQALGGERALRRVETRVITGKRDIPTGPGGMIPMPADVELYQKGPNLTLNVYKTGKFTISDGFDGTTAWTKNAAGVVATPPSPDSSRVRRAANLQLPLELKAVYTRMLVTGIEPVNGHEAYVVVAVPADDLPERLYFDRQSGLLLRTATMLATAVGMSPFETNYEDYRVTQSGAKVPYVIRMNPAGPRTEIPTVSTLRVTKVQEGVPLDDRMFARPASLAGGRP
jgi:hypothetical protein